MKVPTLLVAALLMAPTLLCAQEDTALARARELLRTSILFDGHNDLPWAVRIAKENPGDVAAYDLRSGTSGHTDLPRLKEGGVGAQFWSVYIPAEDPEAGYARVQLEQIDLARRIISRYPDRLTLALTADDVERAFEAGRIASLIGMEGGHAIENSLGALRAYYDLGARYMTLTHNGTLDWADAATDTARHGGLTRFGEEVVREMNRLGMLVDLSHASPDSMRDAIRVSEAPVMFSHSSARALCDVPRNVPDAVLELMPENGGIVMITFVPSFVSQAVADVAMPAWQEVTERSRGVEDPEQQRAIFEEVFSSLELPKVSIAQVADHVDHVRKVAGADHVGIGGDYDGASIWPEGLEDVSRYPHLFAELVRRGWSDGDLRKLAGENMLRVLRKAEETGQRLQTLRQPSIATIESLDGPAHD